MALVNELEVQIINAEYCYSSDSVPKLLPILQGLTVFFTLKKNGQH